QEVLGFSDSIAYNNPSPYYDPIVSNSSLTLTPFDESDVLLFEEADAFIAINDEPVSPVFNAMYYDPEELKVVEPKKSSIEYATSYEPKVEIPEVKLKELPPHLEYAFLEENNKLPVIISKDLSLDEKTSLINVLKNQKQVASWEFTPCLSFLFSYLMILPTISLKSLVSGVVSRSTRASHPLYEFSLGRFISFHLID
ncbi:hypothetical protein Tco_0061876, partial [Tanacetum coccineum]